MPIASQANAQQHSDECSDAATQIDDNLDGEVEDREAENGVPGPPVGGPNRFAGGVVWVSRTAADARVAVSVLAREPPCQRPGGNTPVRARPPLAMTGATHSASWSLNGSLIVAQPWWVRPTRVAAPGRALDMA